MQNLALVMVVGMDESEQDAGPLPPLARRID